MWVRVPSAAPTSCYCSLIGIELHPLKSEIKSIMRYIDIYSYENARCLFENGDIVFIQKFGNKIISSLIQFFTRSKYVHVGIAIWINIEFEHRLMIIEAKGGGPRRIVNMSDYGSANMDVYANPMPWTEIKEQALERVGIIHYGYSEAVYVGVREFLLKYLNFSLPEHNFPGEICSEFVAKLCGLENVHVSPQIVKDQLIAMNCKHKFRVNE